MRLQEIEKEYSWLVGVNTRRMIVQVEDMGKILEVISAAIELAENAPTMEKKRLIEALGKLEEE